MTAPTQPTIQDLRAQLNTPAHDHAIDETFDRLEAAESQLKAIGIALEWPGQDDRALLEVVKEAAMDGVLRCQQFAEMHRLRTAQRPRDMAEMPESGSVLAVAMVEVDHIDRECHPYYDGWLPLPDQTKPKAEEPKAKSVAELLADDPQCSALVRGLFTDLQDMANNDPELQARIARKRGQS